MKTPYSEEHVCPVKYHTTFLAFEIKTWHGEVCLRDCVLRSRQLDSTSRGPPTLLSSLHSYPSTTSTTSWHHAACVGAEDFMNPKPQTLKPQTVMHKRVKAWCVHAENGLLITLVCRLILRAGLSSFFRQWVATASHMWASEWACVPGRTGCWR